MAGPKGQYIGTFFTVYHQVNSHRRRPPSFYPLERNVLIWRVYSDCILYQALFCGLTFEFFASRVLVFSPVFHSECAGHPYDLT